MTLSKFTEVLRLIEADIKASEDIDSNEQRAAESDKEYKELVGCEEIKKKKKRRRRKKKGCLSSQT
jgi:hypothetical protein